MRVSHIAGADDTPVRFDLAFHVAGHGAGLVHSGTGHESGHAGGLKGAALP